MLDARYLRTNPPGLREAILARNGDPFHLDQFLEADVAYRRLLSEVETLRAERTKESLEVGRRRKAGEDAATLQAEVKALGDRLKLAEEALGPALAAAETALHWLPNLAHASVPVGDAAHNTIVKTWKEPRRFDFPIVPHEELGARLDWIDMPRGTRMSGPGFPVLKGLGAKLERALINFFLDVHTLEHGHTEVAAPFLVRRESLFGTGQLPKLEDDMYRTTDDLFLIPTAEVSITNLYREEILDAALLPIRHVGFSPCFRREAGSYGRDTKGLTRVHQFMKVEMVRITTPEASYDEHEKLLADAEDILQRLDLPYRVLLLASGDTSFAAAKCYDLEVYASGADRWLEVSSCSNFEAFQARRLKMRYRPEPGAKPEFVHTLNASGLALPRILIAIIENYQTADGRVRVPEVLVPYLGGLRELGG
ncbi:MAG: serine--tRNA ligase [Candidatus Eisenbacteria bacterium]|nr:serine--tRNA ligase [Candidatus Eisenbacteria bacterium]